MLISLPPNRLLVTSLTVHSEPVYALLDSGAIPNVMSTGLAKKLKLDLEPTNRRIIVADGSSGSCQGVVSAIPVGFGDIVKRLDFMVVDSVPYDLIIGAPTLVKLCTRIDLYHQTVKLRHNGQSETLNLEYEPEIGDDTNDDFTSESETEEDIGEDSETGDLAGLVLTINESDNQLGELSKTDLTEEKLAHLDSHYASKLRALFDGYEDVIAESFDDVRPSNVSVRHSFELTSDRPIFQKLRRVPHEIPAWKNCTVDGYSL